MDFLLDRFKQNQDSDAIIWKDQAYSYRWLSERIDHWKHWLDKESVLPGSVVFLEADFTPNAIALFLALTHHRCILVPFAPTVQAKKAESLSIAMPDMGIRIQPDDQISWERFDHPGSHAFYEKLKKEARPGLVLFSSGSTGKMKAAVHDLTKILEKFKVLRHSLRTVTFLLYDHIGGVNTMFYTLSNAGCIITVPDRSPETVLAAIEKHRVELLPTSPTFLNLILLSGLGSQYRLDTLKTVTYGTEPMLQSTLEKFHITFPHIQLLQTYGLSEVGILRSKSKSSDSLWMKVGGEGFESRIVNGKLQIKAESAMLGYLNAPSPFTADGWLDTGDSVISDGEYIRILGRESEIINVGGEKVYPAEVESAIQELSNVAEVTVYGEKNFIVGNIVCAKVSLSQPEDEEVFSTRLKQHCAKKLDRFKIPVKVEVVQDRLHSDRIKKIRT